LCYLRIIGIAVTSAFVFAIKLDNFSTTIFYTFVFEALCGVYIYNCAGCVSDNFFLGTDVNKVDVVNSLDVFLDDLFTGINYTFRAFVDLDINSAFTFASTFTGIVS